MILLFCLLNYTGCGKFSYSAYMMDVSGNSKNLNAKAIEAILKRQSQFDEKFKVVVTADTHNYYAELSSLVKAINRKKEEYAFMIIVGDITNIGLYSEYKATIEILSDLQIPWVVTIGNHDLLNYGKEIYQFYFGKADFQILFKNVCFVLFNNNNWEEDKAVPDVNWLKEKLSEGKEQIKVLLSHIPPNDLERFSQNEIKAWENLVSRYQVDYYLNGHNHNPGYSYFSTTLNITVGSPVKGKYLELTFNRNSTSHAFIDF